MEIKKVIIIAEAGVNYNGNYELAKEMAVVAHKAGADIVKFQTAIPELVMTSQSPKVAYQINSTGSRESQLDMAKKIMLRMEDFKPLMEYCEREVGIKFLSTPFDHVSIDLLNNIGMDTFKIPSGEVTNIPFLKAIGQLRKKVILSTGMSNLGEVENALNVLVKNGTTFSDIIVLHCNTEYPTPYQDVNLMAMVTIKDAFKVRVGYSDHTSGIEVPIAAVAMGAEIIEKHFTLDRNWEGPDHRASLIPTELQAMVESIRNIEKSLGDGIKKPSESEMSNLFLVRRSIHLKEDLGEGATLKESNFIMKRPGDGISSMMIETLIGRKLKRSLPVDHKLQWEDLQ